MAEKSVHGAHRDNGATTDAEGPTGETTEPSVDVLSTSAAGPTAMRGAALRVSGYVTGLLASGGSAALLFRHLGVVGTGRYVTALSLIMMVGGLSDLGITAIGVREISVRPPPERWVLARDLLGLRLFLTVIGGVAITAIAWTAYSTLLATGVAIAGVGLLLQVTQDNFVLPLLVELRLGWVSVIDLIRQLLTALFLVLLVLLNAGLLPFLAVSIPVGAIVVVIAGTLVKHTRTLTPTFSWHRWRAFLAVILPYSAATAASVFYYRISVVIVSALSNGLQLGYFSASFRVLEAATIVPGLLASSVFPIFARAAHDDQERFGYALRRAYDIATIVGAWLTISVAVGAPLAMAIIGGSHFQPAASVLAIQGIGLGAMFVNFVSSYALLSLNKYWVLLALSCGALILNVLLVGPLVLLAGARGAALGTATAEVVLTVVGCLVLTRGRPNLRPSFRVFPRVALASITGLSPLLLPGVPTIGRLFISSAAFGLVLLATRALPPDVMNLIPNLPLISASRYKRHS